MALIKVPKTPKSSFNKNRPASALLKSQIQHLEWAVRPASQRKPEQLPTRSVKTEGQAAAIIARLTAQLHPMGDAPRPAAPTQPAPPAPTPKKRPRRRSAKKAGGSRKRRRRG